MPFSSSTTVPEVNSRFSKKSTALTHNHVAAIREMLSIEVTEDEAEEKKRLQSLSKAELIEHFMRAKVIHACRSLECYRLK